MDGLLSRPVLVVYGLLLAVTVLSWRLGGSAGAAVLVLAIVKARLVVTYFMNLRVAPRALQLGVDAVLIGVGCGLVGLYVWA